MPEVLRKTIRPLKIITGSFSASLELDITATENLRRAMIVRSATNGLRSYKEPRRHAHFERDTPTLSKLLDE